MTRVGVLGTGRMGSAFAKSLSGKLVSSHAAWRAASSTLMRARTSSVRYMLKSRTTTSSGTTSANSTVAAPRGARRLRRGDGRMGGT